MLTSEQHQRIVSALATLRPWLIPLMERTADRLAQAFPAAHTCLPMSSKTDRYEAACMLALACKKLDRPEDLESLLASAGARLYARGLDMAAAGPFASRVLLDEIRDALDEGPMKWNAQLESDFRALVGWLVPALARGAAIAAAQQPGPSPVRTAATTHADANADPARSARALRRAA